MLQCSIMNAERLRLSLEDVLGDLWHARRMEDLGRLALVVHCDLRRWARVANRELLAKHSQELVLTCPQATREEYLRQIDQLIREAERVYVAISLEDQDSESLFKEGSLAGKGA
jgi:hypothetical protein